MSSYPVGSLCVTVNGNGKLYKDVLGMECTITEGRAIRSTVDREGVAGNFEAYMVVGLCTNEVAVAPENLRLKRFPPDTDAWLQTKMYDLLNNAPHNILEGDSV